MTADRVTAYDTKTGEEATVPWRWVDNPAIFHGRYVSTKPTTKSARARREPVEPQAVVEADEPIEPDVSAGESHEVNS